MFFSIKSCGFFKKSTHGDRMPDDAIAISDEEYVLLTEALSNGKIVSGYKNGVFVVEDQEGPSTAEALHNAKVNLRAMRAPMLDALTGIAGRAERAGNTALALEADALAEQLLDITDDPALNAATTYEAMQAAGVDAYRAIAATASPALASVFKEITGA